jgi:hypothetical protein
MDRMNRVVVTTWLSVLCVVASAGPAMAQRGRTNETPHSDAIAPALGDISWGMTKDELLGHFTKKVKDEYRPKLAKAPGAIEEQRLRHQMTEEIRRIRESYVEFTGRTTGWDVSFLRDEFTHRNGESMLVVKDGRAQNFYFFINNRLWKWYRAFNQEVFANASFDEFAAALQARFGKARERRGAVHEGASEKHWLEWQNDNTRLRAIDETTFYGFYCLVFEDKDVLSRLDELRTHQRARRDDGHSLVESVTVEEGDGSGGGDANRDIVDRITGKIRRREQAPEED